MAPSKPEIRLVRAYDLKTRDSSDVAGRGKPQGYRVLIDRLWPRGVSKEVLALDQWAKELSPSTELRKWFNHRPDRWEEFRQRYFEELGDQASLCDDLLAAVGGRPLVLIYGARDSEHNNAVALREFLLGKPPRSGTSGKRPATRTTTKRPASRTPEKSPENRTRRT